MLKKVTALFLCFVTLLAFASCGKNKGEKIVPSDKKVAILVAPCDQYPEDYAAAMALQKEFPKQVIVKEYSDSRILKAGDGEIITLSEEMAKDESVGAILYARATEFTDDAIYKAEAINPDIITLAIEPEDNLSLVAKAASLVFTCNWDEAAKNMVNSAKAMGAEYFVFLTFARHAENELVVQEQEAFAAACKEAGISMQTANCFDPTSAEGMERTKLVAKEQIAQMELNKKIEGKNVVLFSTDSAVQGTLAEVAEQKGMIYLSPNFPSAFGGAADYFAVGMPEKYEDIDGYAKAIQMVAPNRNGRFALYDYCLMTAFVKGAVYTAFDLLNGIATAENVTDRVALRMQQAGDAEVTVTPAEGEYNNIYRIYRTAQYTAL